MWPLFLTVLGPLKRYWKPLLIGSVAVIVVFGAYLKGSRDCARRQEKAALKEVVNRVEDSQEERARVEEIDVEIDRRRSTQPNDALDSCLLSGDPYTKRCLK